MSGMSKTLIPGCTSTLSYWVLKQLQTAVINLVLNLVNLVLNLVRVHLQKLKIQHDRQRGIEGNSRIYLKPHSLYLLNLVYLRSKFSPKIGRHEQLILVGAPQAFLGRFSDESSYFSVGRFELMFFNKCTRRTRPSLYSLWLSDQVVTTIYDGPIYTRAHTDDAVRCRLSRSQAA